MERGTKGLHKHEGGTISGTLTALKFKNRQEKPRLRCREASREGEKQSGASAKGAPRSSLKKIQQKSRSSNCVRRRGKSASDNGGGSFAVMENIEETRRLVFHG